MSRGGDRGSTRDCEAPGRSDGTGRVGVALSVAGSDEASGTSAVPSAKGAGTTQAVQQSKQQRQTRSMK